MAQTAAAARNKARRRRTAHLFPYEASARGILRIGAERAEALCKEGKLDLTESATFKEYYRRLYSSLDRDPGVLAAEKDLRFKVSARLGADVPIAEGCEVWRLLP